MKRYTDSGAVFERIPATRVRVGHTIRIYGGVVSTVTAVTPDAVSRNGWMLSVDPHTVPDGYTAPTEYYVYLDLDWVDVREEWESVDHPCYYVQNGDFVSVDRRYTGMVTSVGEHSITLSRPGKDIRIPIGSDTEIKVRNF